MLLKFVPNVYFWGYALHLNKNSQDFTTIACRKFTPTMTILSRIQPIQFYVLILSKSNDPVRLVAALWRMEKLVGSWWRNSSCGADHVLGADPDVSHITPMVISTSTIHEATAVLPIIDTRNMDDLLIDDNNDSSIDTLTGIQWLGTAVSTLRSHIIGIIVQTEVLRGMEDIILTKSELKNSQTFCRFSLICWTQLLWSGILRWWESLTFSSMTIREYWADVFDAVIK